MPRTEAQRRAKNKYAATHYDQVLLQLPKGKKAEYTEQANAHGLTLKQYIVLLIEKDRT